MRYRRFGRTEINMPIISTGGMRFQASWKREDPIKPESVANLERIIGHALDLGINHFETAHGYGTSEKELGQALPNFDRSKLVIQSKGSPTEIDKATGAFAIETSLKAMNQEYLDLFAVHGINTDFILNRALKKDGIVEKALALKKKGIIRHLGFSTHGPRSTIIKAIQTGKFDYLNLWYSYINQANWPVILEAQKQDMGVFIISPNDKGGQLFKPPQTLTDLCAPLSPMTFNDIFILSHPEIHTISCGATCPEDLDEHCRAVERMDELKPTVDEIVTRLDQALDQVRDAQWRKHYTDGVPNWPDTPGNVNVPVILWLWNLARAFDLVDYGQYRYNLLGNAEHWFPGQQLDKALPDQEAALAQALEDSPYRDWIMEILPKAHTLFKTAEGKRLQED
jgi:uncharacterized protein